MFARDKRIGPYTYVYQIPSTVTTKSCSVSLGLAVSTGRSGLTSAAFAAFENAMIEPIRRAADKYVTRLKTEIIADHRTASFCWRAVPLRDLTAPREAIRRNRCGRRPTLFCHAAGGPAMSVV
jgi:hypothetical protein